VTASGRRDGKPFQATYLFLTSLRTTPQELLQLLRDAGGLKAGTGSAIPSSLKMPTVSVLVAQVR
jgi:hypothetical protein